MKTQIKTIALVAVLFLSSFATSYANPLKNRSSLSILETYLEATTLGNPEFNRYLFTSDFEYTIASVNVSKFNKKQYSKFLEENKGTKYDCKTTYEVIEEKGEVCIAKATMEFATFTRVDYITLVNSKDAWKVSKVVTTYP